MSMYKNMFKFKHMFNMFNVLVMEHDAVRSFWRSLHLQKLILRQRWCDLGEPKLHVKMNQNDSNTNLMIDIAESVSNGFRTFKTAKLPSITQMHINTQ